MTISSGQFRLKEICGLRGRVIINQPTQIERWLRRAEFPPTGFLQSTAFLCLSGISRKSCYLLAANKLRIYVALAFGLSLGFATLGCASREVTDWAPLAVGHRWAYREINRVDPARPQMDTIYLEVLKADPNFENGYSVRRSAGAGRTRTEMEIWFKKFDPQGYSFWLSDPNLSYVLCVLMVPPERGGWRLEGREDGAYCLYKGLRSVFSAHSDHFQVVVRFLDIHQDLWPAEQQLTEA